MFTGSIVWKGLAYTALMALAKGSVSIVIYFHHFKNRYTHNKKQPTSTQQQADRGNNGHCRSDVPHGAALLIGLAMIARGEVGFLIASLAQSSDTLIFRSHGGSENNPGNEDLFVVLVWAITLCTIIGPLGVGIMTKRLGQRARESLRID